jgi:hypothetical protein
MATYAQIYQLVNAITEGSIGNRSITVKDTTSLISLGNQVLKSDENKEEFYKKLPDVIGRIICRYQAIKRRSRDIEVDPLTFGIAVEEVWKDSVARAKKNNSWGDQVNPFDVLKKDDTAINVSIYKELAGWELDKITYDYQLEKSFHNAAEMASFLSLIMQDMYDGMTQALNDTDRITECTAIAQSIYGAASTGAQTAINLFTAYKTEVDPSTTLTAATCVYNSDWLRFATEKILNIVENAKELGVLYNTAGAERELADDFKLHMLSEFANKLSIYLHADTYHEDLLKLPGFSKINSWQGLGRGATFAQKSKIDIINGDLQVSQGGIVAHLFDRGRMMTMVDKIRTKSFYNGASELTNWYHKADIGYLIRPYEIGVVFYIADADWTITSLPAITLSALPGTTDLWGTLVSSIQNDITVTGDKITGTLYPVTEGALPAKWGEGYFIAIQFTADSWTPYTSVKVGMDPSESSGLVELINDPDKAGVFKVSDKDIQLVAVLGTDGKDVLYRTYDISGLTLSETPPNETKKSKK